MTKIALLSLWLSLPAAAGDPAAPAAAAPAAAPAPAEPKKESKPAAASALKNDDQKTLYTLGYFLGNKATPLNISASEAKHVELGFRDGLNGKKPQVDPEVYGPKVNELAMERTKKQREAAMDEAKKAAQGRKDAEKGYLEKMAAEKGAQKLSNGAIVKELKAGSGKNPTADDTVKCHYEGKLVDGTVFDSSVKRGEPAEFPLRGVIPCWTEGVQKIKVGGKALITCPSDIAYGDEGRPPVIPPGAALTFEVELLDIVKK